MKKRTKEQTLVVPQRNLGIDLLRIISMFFVVILHLLGQGGILLGEPRLSVNWTTAWTMETAAYCAVNCFALISGYVGVTSKFRLSKAASLWAQTAFYSITITVGFLIFSPEKIGEIKWLRYLFPMGTYQYWYTSAYFGLLFLTPFLNEGAKNTSKRTLVIFLCFTIIGYGFLPIVFQRDSYNLYAGGSMVWLAILYVIGAGIKIHGIPKFFTRKKSILFFFLTVIVATAGKIIIEEITLNMYGKFMGDKLFLSYTSPLILGSAIFLLFCCAQLEIKNNIFKKIITFLSPAALGVYLIHTHEHMWHHVIYNCMSSVVGENTFVLVGKVILGAVIVYMVCSLLEKLRIDLFNVLKIPKLFKKLDKLM